MRDLETQAFALLVFKEAIKVEHGGLSSFLGANLVWHLEAVKDFLLALIPVAWPGEQKVLELLPVTQTLMGLHV